MLPLVLSFKPVLHLMSPHHTVQIMPSPEKHSRNIPHLLLHHLSNLSTLAKPHTPQIHPQRRIQRRRLHLRYGPTKDPDPRTVEAEIQSPKLLHGIGHRTVDGVLGAAITTYTEDLRGLIDGGKNGGGFFQTLDVQVDNGDFPDAVGHETSRYCEADS